MPTIFSHYENVMTKGKAEREKPDKIDAYLARTAFNFYFDSFRMHNGPIRETGPTIKLKV